MEANSGGDQNTAVGMSALNANTVGNNTAIGYAAMFYNTSGTENVAVGVNAMCKNTTADGNVAIGNYAMKDATTGNNNTAVGYCSLKDTTTGHSNTAVGRCALHANTTGIRNTAVGLESLKVVEGAGNENTAIGYASGCTITTGDENVMLGYRAGRSTTTGSCNIVIGSAAYIDAGDTNNSIAMGYDVVSINNAVTFGNASTDSRIAFGATSISAPSDLRLKEEINDSTAGLDFINDLRPVTYKWRQEKDIPEEMRTHVAGSTKRYNNDKVNHGFIAQEVKEAIDKHPELKDGFNMWSEESTLDGRQRVAEDALVPMLVKAIQELTDQNKKLTSRIEELEKENN